MTARSARLLLVLVGCLPLQAILAGQLDDIVNYREYSATLSSSGQPDADQLEYLRNAGFERAVFLAFSDHQGSVPNEDMNTVWVPNDTWRSLIFDTLEENDVSPHCDTCLWERD